jgi:hypothetical protein
MYTTFTSNCELETLCNDGRIGPPCSARGLHATRRFPPWAVCVGQVPPYKSCSMLSDVLWWPVFAGMLPRMVRGLHAPSFQRQNSSRRSLCCLGVLYYVCIF